MSLDVATIIRGTGAHVIQLTANGDQVHGGLSRSELATPILDVTVDSRNVRPGSLFVALKGEHMDGHQFVAQALSQGAAGCVIQASSHATRDQGPVVLTGDSTKFLFAVDDPLAALQRLATSIRRGSPAAVIGITGSVGKTTTKEIVASVLSQAMPVLWTEANLNTEIGMPLMLTRWQPSHRAAVLELGMHVVGDIKLLAAIAQPNLGIVTNVAPVHLERMGTIERIAHEKSELVAALPADGLAILNGDDRWARAMAQTSGLAPTVLVGRGDSCDYRIDDVETDGLQGLRFVLEAEGERMQMQAPLAGAHLVPALCYAAAAARYLDMSWPAIREAITRVKLDIRQRIITTSQGHIIDDSYNASPLSVKAALDVLRAAPGLRVAVLGDMLELGADEEAAHRDVGAYTAATADCLVAVGPRGRWIADEAVQAGMPVEQVLHVGTKMEAVRALQGCATNTTSTSQPPASLTMQRPETAPGASVPERTVLVKGSRGMKMEEVVHELREDA